uniref:Uncharacterized protein n=1 Tax=Lactuca sativa TaxID=4236 RepID=A0A9R1VUW2_LACSA|nr:hypothetical protein LSAT_V11C400224640 [Lactuca sativa]
MNMAPIPYASGSSHVNPLQSQSMYNFAPKQNDLDVLKDIFTMKLRVIRLRTLDYYYNKNKLFSIEHLLMNKKLYNKLIGNKIQIYVLKNYIYKFRKVLKEGNVFFIKSLNLAKMDQGES